MRVKTILVIRSSAMGDVAMAAPVVDALIKSYPDVRVVMLTRVFFEPFFKKNEHLIIHNIDLHGKHKGVSGVFRLYKELKREYDIELVADLHGKLYSMLLCFFFKLGGIRNYAIDKGRKGKRELTRQKNKILKQLPTSISNYIKVFERAGFPVKVSDDLSIYHTERPVPKIFAPKNAIEIWIGFAPFAQHRGKMISLQTVNETISLIESELPEAKVFIFGGGENEKREAEKMELQHMNTVSAIGKMNLAEELDMKSNLDLLISMDSSAMHLSALVGLRVISIWGATHPYAGFLGLGQSEDDVVQINDLECRPCSVYGNKPCLRGDYACLNRITARMIVERVKQALK